MFGLFGLFESRNYRKIDESIMIAGSALHKQIKSASDEVNQSNRKAIFSRMDDAFTAGYLFGYVQSFFSEFELPEKEMEDCMRKIFDGIFPSSGYAFVMSKIDQLNNADDMGLNVTIEQVALDFGTGIDLSEKDVLVNSGGLEVATSLSVYITSGKVMKID